MSRPENKVIKDITKWREQVQIPDVIANCSSEGAVGAVYGYAGKIDRNENLVMAFMPTGVFERLHFLMGFEDTADEFPAGARGNDGTLRSDR
jgi:hypothetical protein